MPVPLRAAVTVVIPCFDQARFLSAAVLSVAAQRGPTVACIVVDDGSSDDASRVATRLGVKVIRQERRGVSEARNAGLAAADTEFIIFLDADDELIPGAVARGAAALHADRAAAAVVGRCRPMTVAGEVLPVRYPDLDTSDLYGEWLSQNFVWTPGAAIFRREALVEIGGFPGGLGPAADYAVYLRLARSGRVRFIAEELVRYRQHQASMSRDAAMMLRATLAVLRREGREVQAARAGIRQGRRRWCEWYGEQIVDRLRADWHADQFDAGQLFAALTLLRYCPRVVLRHATHKAYLVGASFARRTRGAFLHTIRRRRVVP